MVDAKGHPTPLAPGTYIQTVPPGDRIVSMTEYQGHIFVATETGVFRANASHSPPVFEPLRFKVE